MLSTGLHLTSESTIPLRGSISPDRRRQVRGSQRNFCLASRPAISTLSKIDYASGGTPTRFSRLRPDIR